MCARSWNYILGRDALISNMRVNVLISSVGTLANLARELRAVVSETRKQNEPNPEYILHFPQCLLGGFALLPNARHE